MPFEYTRLRPHWRPTHDATPIGFDRWIGPDGPNAWVKLLNPDGHLVRQVWRAAPQARICLRLHGLSEQKDALEKTPSQLATNHALEWDNWLREQDLVAQATMGVLVMEGINEPSIWEPPIAVAYNLYAEQFAVRMRGRGYTAVLGNINTGHPPNHGPDTPPDWEPLLKTLQATREFGHVLGLHEYCDQRGPDSDDWTWNMGRFLQLPKEYADLPILMTECGYDWAVNKPGGTASHGWQGHLATDVYMGYLAEYDRRLRSHPNVLAAFVFTHDFDQPWSLFDTRPLLDSLIEHAERVRTTPVQAQVQPPVKSPVKPSIQLPYIAYPPLTEGPTIPPGWGGISGLSQEPSSSGGTTMPILPSSEVPISEQPSPSVQAQKRNPARQDYLNLFVQYGAQYSVPWYVLAALAYHESAYEPNAVSYAGAQGLMQFMPATWADMQKALSVTDPFNAQQSIQASAYYLAQLRQWLPAEKREWRWVLAAYNWGPGRVSRATSWEDAPIETRQYARNILVGSEMLRRWEENF